jgi:hypothetical protein
VSCTASPSKETEPDTFSPAVPGSVSVGLAVAKNNGEGGTPWYQACVPSLAVYPEPASFRNRRLFNKEPRATGEAAM